MRIRNRVAAFTALALALALAAAPPAPPSAAAVPTIPDVGIWYATWYSKLPALPATARTNFGGSSANQFIGDVNADGRADAVTFASSGSWQVALSNGTGFGTPTTWISGHGSGSSEQYLADVNGDGRQDAVVYFAVDANAGRLEG